MQKIVLTDDMLQAGVKVLLTFSPDVESHGAIVREIFETMMEIMEGECDPAQSELPVSQSHDAMSNQLKIEDA